MRVRRLTLGPLDTNCWLADDGAGGPPDGDEEAPVRARLVGVLTAVSVTFCVVVPPAVMTTEPDQFE